jgi:hypothetical protein
MDGEGTADGLATEGEHVIQFADKNSRLVSEKVADELVLEGAGGAGSGRGLAHGHGEFLSKNSYFLFY